jgi:hypothetical protein
MGVKGVGGMTFKVLVRFGIAVAAFAAGLSFAGLPQDVEIFKDSILIGKMIGEDQAGRFGWNSLMTKGYSPNEISTHPDLGRRLEQIDRENTITMKKLVDRWGWFPISQFGDHTSHNAWLLVQHADREVSFQERCLKNMEGLIKKKEVRSDDYAYLFDRVQVNRNRAQRFGTQGECKGKGKWAPKSILEPALLEERRKEFGLPSMKEYLVQVSKYCF